MSTNINPFRPGQKITVFSISDFMATTIKRRLTVKSVLPEPVARLHYQNGPIEGYRYGAMVPERKRTSYCLDVKLDNLVFEGWEVPFKTDGEVEMIGGPGCVTKMFSGNACYNLAGDPAVIKEWIETRALIPVPDSTKGCVLVIPIGLDGRRLSDEDGGLLYPEIEIHHAVIDRIKGELQAEHISYGELHELQCLVPHIEPGDMELLEAAGVPEEEAQRHKKQDQNSKGAK